MLHNEHRANQEISSHMRTGPLTAALLILTIPCAAQASANDLTLSGPATLMLTGATEVPLRVALSLEKVLCTSEAEVPVRLSLARVDGVRASLASERVVFRIPAATGLARAWSGEAEARLLLAPTGAGAAGAVETLARYELPAQCSAIGGAREGEARHAIGLATVATGDMPAPLRAIAAAPVGLEERTGLPWGGQIALLVAVAGGIAIVAKRLRWRARHAPAS